MAADFIQISVDDIPFKAAVAKQIESYIEKKDLEYAFILVIEQLQWEVY